MEPDQTELEKWQFELKQVAQSLELEPQREDLIEARRELLNLVSALSKQPPQFTVGSTVSVKVGHEIKFGTVVSVTGPLGEQITVRTSSGFETVTKNDVRIHKST